MILCFIVLSSFRILLYTCANVICIKFLLTYTDAQLPALSSRLLLLLKNMFTTVHILLLSLSSICYC